MNKIKENQGITLVVLIIYVILTIIILGILTTLTMHFRSNIDNVNVQTAYDTEFDKLNMQLIKETKIEKNFIDMGTATDVSITFKNGNTYTYDPSSRAIYLNNNIKIAEYLTDVEFYVKEEENRQKLTVILNVIDSPRKIEYVIAGEKFEQKKATEYENNGKIAWIPNGFTISGIESEQSIDGGLVIYDIPEGTTVDWTNPDSVKTQYNQFVWIPVEVNKTTEPKDTETSIASFKRSVWQDNARVANNAQSETSFPSSSDSWSNYTEPYSSDDSDYDGTGTGKTGISAQITELTKSIYKYGGFYIGRYEAGSETARTSNRSQTAAFVVQQDKYPYNYAKWGKGMGDISEGAVYLSNSLYTGKTGYGVKSMLCTGAAWDSMLDFIKDSSHNVTSSRSWGNHYDSATYKVYRGSLSSDYGSTWSVADTTNGSDVTKTEDSSILLTTGATERNSSKNIYDVAGNCDEWTTEAAGTTRRVYRGGFYYYGYGSSSTASNRISYYPSNTSFHYSFRPLLYVAL